MRKLIYAAVAVVAFILILAAPVKLHAATVPAPVLSQCSVAGCTIYANGLPKGGAIYVTAELYRYESGVKESLGSYSREFFVTTYPYFTWLLDQSDVDIDYTAYSTYEGSTSATTTVTVIGAY
jgi:hypothetical protein